MRPAKVDIHSKCVRVENGVRSCARDPLMSAASQVNSTP